MSKKASKKSAKKANVAAVLNQEIIDMAPLPEQFSSKDFGRTILLNAIETKTSTIAQIDSFQWVMQKQYASTSFQF